MTLCKINYAKNISHANNKTFCALRDGIFLRFRMHVPTLIFFSRARENCMVIADSERRVLAILLTDFPSQFPLVIQ